MSTNTAAREAATIESMHTGDYTAPDMEYTPITAPLPRLVRREELDAMRGERDSLTIECALLRAERDQLRGIRDTLEAERNAATARAEAAAWQDGGFCSQCGADRVRVSTDDIDVPMLHTLSYCVACGGFWIWDHEAQQSEAKP